MTPPPPWAACSNASPLLLRRNFSYFPIWNSLVQCKAYHLSSYSCYLRDEADPHLTTTSSQAAVESHKVSPEPPPVWTIPPPSATPHKICAPDPSQLCCPSLNTLQELLKPHFLIWSESIWDTFYKHVPIRRPHDPFSVPASPILSTCQPSSTSSPRWVSCSPYQNPGMKLTHFDFVIAPIIKPPQGGLVTVYLLKAGGILILCFWAPDVLLI